MRPNRLPSWAPIEPNVTGLGSRNNKVDSKRATMVAYRQPAPVEFGWIQLFVQCRMPIVLRLIAFKGLRVL